MIVLGSGLAGQILALSVADRKSVLVARRFSSNASASTYAQGGISAVYSANGSHEKHFNDTLNVQLAHKVSEGVLIGWLCTLLISAGALIVFK
ncbi:FAD-binding protein [Limoniibacter endophyticus]|uniref:FAD-binding protein n=1 Tax=Limoniibacter endophyticus TaxID=1565040 RepID=UPI00167703B5